MIALVWTLAFLVGIGFFVFQMYGRLGVLLRLRKDDGRNYGSATWSKRVKNTLLYAFGQYKFFLGEKTSGVMHIVIFWGFLVLGLQVTTMFLRGWFPDFTPPGDHVYALLRDIFQAGVLVGIAIAATRWGIVRPTRLFGFLPAEARLRAHSHWEAYLILTFIAGIMISGFFYEAARQTPEEAPWQPLTSLLVPWVGGSALVESIAWWVHNGIILVFLNLLPRSKHFHILTAIPNVFLGKVEPTGKLAKKDYTGDEPLFGRSQPQHFTWKQALDMYSCTECGRCSSFCPATATGKPLAPRQFLLNLRDTVYANQEKLLKKTGTDAAVEFDVVVGEGKPVIDEVVWSCVTCRACEEMCPVNIEYVDKIVDIRQHLVQEASRFPEELNRTFRGLENNSNPWGIGQEERAAWAEGLDVPTIAEKPDAEYLYFVGCGGSYDSKHKKATQSFVKILKQAGVSFAILGKEEKCNGETARRLGNEYLYQTMAESLTQTINGHGVKKILTNCPHCFNTMKHESPEFGGNWDVKAAGVFVKDLIAQGKVTLDGDKLKGKNIVYHDSCYYGRHNGIYDEPREILKHVKGAKLTEMDLNRREGTCCGAGGGRMWVEEQKDQRVNVMRTNQALEKNPDIVASSCPFCRIMIGSGVNEKGMSDKVEVMDVMEIVSASLTNSPVN